MVVRHLRQKTTQGTSRSNMKDVGCKTPSTEPLTERILLPFTTTARNNSAAIAMKGLPERLIVQTDERYVTPGCVMILPIPTCNG